MPKAESQDGIKRRELAAFTDRTLPDPVGMQLRAAVRWTLTREENAAATIQRLSYRISPDSELAMRARAYAADLKYYIARMRSLLPPDPDEADDRSTHDALTETLIASLSPEKATTVLMRFLLQHAETASETVMFAAEKLNSNAIHRLWRRADAKRAKIVTWLQDQESLRLREEDEATRSGSRDVDANEESDEPARETAPHGPDVHSSKGAACNQSSSRLLYNPPQIVRWI